MEFGRWNVLNRVAPSISRVSPVRLHSENLASSKYLVEFITRRAASDSQPQPYVPTRGQISQKWVTPWSRDSGDMKSGPVIAFE